MSDTPRTEDIALRHFKTGPDIDGATHNDHYLQMVEHARTLEREIYDLQTNIRGLQLDNYGMRQDLANYSARIHRQTMHLACKAETTNACTHPDCECKPL